MIDYQQFGENLARFNEVADDMQTEADSRRFYHYLIMECAKVLPVAEFRVAVAVAEQNTRRPK